MMSVRVAVIGGGVSGLAAAHRLRTALGAAATITVLEGSERLGGVLRTVDLAGVGFDVGAEAFLVRRPEVTDLLDELGLTPELAHPTAAAPSVRAGGRTVPLPQGTVLGVPGGGTCLDGVLSPAGLAVVLAEPDRPLHWQRGHDVGLGRLLRARFGDELTDRLVDPLLGGVYAGGVDALGLRATLPALAAALDAGAPSLTAAVDAATCPVWPGRSPAADACPASRPTTPHASPAVPGAPVFGAVRGGYRVLIEALAVAAGADVRLGCTVREVQPRWDGWRLVVGSAAAPEILDVDAVVLAVPAPAAARLLRAAAPNASRAAGEIELASSAVVALAYRATDAAMLPRSSGVLVAADEPQTVKAVTHSSRKWAHLAPEATDGLVRLRASVGRFGQVAPLQVDDAELLATVRADLRELAGITAAPVAVHVQRWGGGLPQYAVGHPDRVRAILDGLPAGLAVAGSALHGVGVPACIATARDAADRVAATVTGDRARADRHSAPVS